MMKPLLFALALISLPALAIAKPPAPSGPPQAPQTLVLIACQLDDLTGTPGHPEDPNATWTGHRDTEWHVSNGEMQCKRIVMPLEDAVAAANPDVKPLMSNFGDTGQCSHAGAMFIPGWEIKNKGWGVLTIGCPTKIVDEKGAVVGWHMPECPTHIRGFEGIRCKFDDSEI